MSAQVYARAARKHLATGKRRGKGKRGEHKVLLLVPAHETRQWQTASVRIPVLLKDKITWKSTFLFLGWTFSEPK